MSSPENNVRPVPQFPPPNPYDRQIPAGQFPPPSPNRSPKPNRKKSIVRLLPLLPPLTVAGILIVRSGGPIEAFDKVKKATQAELGKDFCPPAPPEDVIELYEQKTAPLEAQQGLDFYNKAIQDGLTFAETQYAFEAIESATAAEHATMVLSAHTEYNYGFTVNLDMPSVAFSTPEAIATYKSDLRSFLQYTSFLPSELIKGSNLTSLTIRQIEDTVRLGKEDLPVAGTFIYSTDELGEGSMVLDINSLKTPRVFIHELGHAFQNTACVGYPQKDNAFTQFNPDGFYYGTNAPLEQDYEGITASDYGMLNLREDQAEILEFFLCGDYDGSLTTYDPSLPASPKQAVVLERIDEIAPGSVDYLNGIRNTITKLAYDSQSAPAFEYPAA